MKRSTLRITRWLAVATGAALAILMFLGFAVTSKSQPLPQLTDEANNASWQRWQANDLASYNIQIDVSGPQAATYLVEVRNHQVVLATRDGFPLKTQRTLGTWSVPGMFDTIEVDLNRRGSGVEKNTEKNPSALRLSCLFDEQYGFPSRYRRNELGTQMQVHWKVTEFNALP